MKMKVGGAPFNEDVERVRAVRKAVEMRILALMPITPGIIQPH